MAYVIINGNKYNIPEMSFDSVCELEERGINFLSMDKKNMKLATMARGLVAWVMDVDVKTASKEIESHVANGGDIIEILERIMGSMEKSGFFSKANPKDHQRKGNKVKQYQNANQTNHGPSRSNYPQNRQQRRSNKKYKGKANQS